MLDIEHMLILRYIFQEVWRKKTKRKKNSKEADEKSVNTHFYDAVQISIQSYVYDAIRWLP